MSLKNGKLTVKADNSDLTQILRDVADISGMTIDGLTKNARIFGVYGPGNPFDVLTNLLAGSGYNFILVGDRTDGAPRELLLTAQNNNVPTPPPSTPRPATTDATEPGSDISPPHPKASTPDTGPPAPYGN